MNKKNIISDEHTWVNHWMHKNNRKESWPDIWGLWDDSTKKLFIREALFVAFKQETTSPLLWFWTALAHVHYRYTDYDLFMIDPETVWIRNIIKKKEMQTGRRSIDSKKTKDGGFWLFQKQTTRHTPVTYLLSFLLDIFFSYAMVKVFFAVLYGTMTGW